MGRKKNNGKRDAALLREAAKRGEAIDKVNHNHNHNQLPSFNNDDDEYELEPSSDSEPEPLNHQPAVPKRSRSNSTECATQLRANKRSRTARWRDRTGKTATARAANMSQNITSFFKPARPPPMISLREESEASDSDVNEITEPFVPHFAASPSPSTNSIRQSTPPHTPEDSATILGTERTPSPMSATEDNVDAVASTAPTPSGSEAPPLNEEVESASRDEAKQRNSQQPLTRAEYERLPLIIKVLRVKIRSKKSGQYVSLAHRLQIQRDQQTANLKVTCPAIRGLRRKKQKKIRPMQTASETIAQRFGKGPWFARRLRWTASYVLRTQELPASNQGRGAHHQSPFNQPAIRSAIEKWVKGLVPVKEGGYDGAMRPTKLRTYQFVNYMFSNVIPYSYTYEGSNVTPTAPVLKPDEKRHYAIFHDETCVHANELDAFAWMRDGEQPLRNKSRGRIVHVSDFVLEECGFLRLDEHEISQQLKLPEAPKPPTTSSSRSFEGTDWIPPPPPAPFTSYRLASFDARRIIYPGVKHDAWWDMPQLIAQTKDAIKIFEAKFPDGTAVFVYDCSSAHAAFASDALLAHKMNRYPGGKQPKMRSTIIPATGTGIPLLAKRKV
ncbi:hypothetical protein AB1N83_013390 [Pleurotus pulmonarius]